METHKDQSSVEDLNGYNLPSHCILKFSWECLTEVVLSLGYEILEKFDENAGAKPGDFAKKLGYQEAYEGTSPPLTL